MADNEIRIGVVYNNVGPYVVMGQDAMRGVELAIGETDWQIAGKQITLHREGSNAIPDSAVYATQTLLDDKQVDFVIGPMSGGEGLAVRDYALTRLEKTFLNGNAATQDITLRMPAPNLFSFCGNGVQWMAGLGRYIYGIQRYKRIVTIGEDYSFPYGQVAGLMIEFCNLGGRVVDKFWVPLGTGDFDRHIAEMPTDIDAIFVALGGSDAVNFIQQYDRAGRATPLIFGSSVADQTVLDKSGIFSRRFIGVASAGPVADDNTAPSWAAFVAAYRAAYPKKGLSSPSLVAYHYYTATKASLLALKQIGGHFTTNQTNFKAALQELEFESPTGLVRLDHNRQAIANMFVNVIDARADGTLYSRLVETIPEVNSTLGIPEADYLAMGPINRDNPACP